MVNWLKKYGLNKLVTFLILGTFIGVAVACTPMKQMTEGHVNNGTVCSIVTELVTGAIVQTGLFIVLLLLGTYFLAKLSSVRELTKSELYLRLLKSYFLTITRKVSLRDNCYLCHLFSSGIIHSKVYINYSYQQ